MCKHTAWPAGRQAVTATGNQATTWRALDNRAPTRLIGADLRSRPFAGDARRTGDSVALADAGSFTHAAERMLIAQPTLSQQIRRLEEIVGTQLLQRRREGLRLTK